MPGDFLWFPGVKRIIRMLMLWNINADWLDWLVVCLDKVLIILNVYEYRRLLGYGPNQNGMTQFTQCIYSVTEKTNWMLLLSGSFVGISLAAWLKIYEKINKSKKQVKKKVTYRVTFRVSPLKFAIITKNLNIFCQYLHYDD